jgi:hypothetical protein
MSCHSEEIHSNFGCIRCRSWQDKKSENCTNRTLLNFNCREKVTIQPKKPKNKESGILGVCRSDEDCLSRPFDVRVPKEWRYIIYTHDGAACG